MTNILQAINNLANYPETKLDEIYNNSTRIQQVGDALEYYIKDMFCNTFNSQNLEEKEQEYTTHFSFLGNKNNPPDIMLRDGDAIEVKKIESNNPTTIALNSSYPKNKLYYDDSFITQACRECEEWKEKDILYAIGHVNQKVLNSLWLVYGDCYCADRKTYQRIADIISKGINTIENVEFSETKELGRVNKVDPLGITYLRIRGMWGIEHPKRVFNVNSENNLLNVILTVNKYNSFDKIDREKIEINQDITIENIKIKNPNNPAKLIDAKYIYIRKK